MRSGPVVPQSFSRTLNLLMLIREATGGATPAPNDRVREDELAVVPFIEIELAMGFRPVSIERTLRVLADSLRRAAATESDAWRSDLMEPMLAGALRSSNSARPPLPRRR
jgi:hypothetical protein